MTLRLYPAFIVAKNIANSLDRQVAWCDMDADMLSAEDVKTLLRKLTVSPSVCITKQKELANDTKNKVYVGFGDGSWSLEDYLRYMRDLGDVFERDEVPGCYRLNINSDKLSSVIGRDMSLQELIELVVRIFVTQGTYDVTTIREYFA